MTRYLVNKLLHNIRFGSIIVMVFFVALNVNATDYYVATTGSDLYTNAQAQNPATPWLSIQKAADSVTLGSTVHVAPGVYTGSVYFRRGGASESTRVIFVSDQKWGAKIVGDVNAQEAVAVVQASYFNFENFDVTVGGEPVNAYKGINIDGTDQIAASHVIIKGNYVHDIHTTTDEGIGIEDSYYYLGPDGNSKSQFNEISNNYFTRLDGYAIYISTAHAIVESNLIVNVGRFGVHLWHAANEVEVNKNIIINVHRGAHNFPNHQQSVGIIVGAGDAPGSVTNDNTQVKDNIIMGTVEAGIQEQGLTGPGNIYRNNTFYEAGSYNYDLKTGKHDQKNNIFFIYCCLLNFYKHHKN